MDTVAALFEWFIYFVRNWGIPIMGAWVAWLMFWGRVKGFTKDHNKAGDGTSTDWSGLITSYIGLIIVCILAWVVIGAIANIIFQGGTTVSGTLGFN